MIWSALSCESKNIFKNSSQLCILKFHSWYCCSVCILLSLVPLGNLLWHGVWTWWSLEVPTILWFCDCISLFLLAFHGLPVLVVCVLVLSHLIIVENGEAIPSSNCPYSPKNLKELKCCMSALGLHTVLWSNRKQDKHSISNSHRWLFKRQWGNVWFT